MKIIYKSSAAEIAATVPKYRAVKLGVAAVRHDSGSRREPRSPRRPTRHFTRSRSTSTTRTTGETSAGRLADDDDSEPSRPSRLLSEVPTAAPKYAQQHLAATLALAAETPDEWQWVTFLDLATIRLAREQARRRSRERRAA